MASALPLRAALTRGTLLTSANWPIVLIEFTIESLYKLALAVPIVGGAFMVAVLLGEDVGVLFEEGLRSAVELVVQSLHNAPVALASFLLAVGLVAVGGAVLLFGVKAGTLGTLVSGDQQAPDFRRGPVTLNAVRRGGAYDAKSVLATIRHYWARSARLAVALSVAYLLIGLVYIGALAFALRVSESSAWAPLWPLIMLISTSMGFVAVAAVNLASDLLRVIMLTDDCDLGSAVQRLRRFVIQDARQVLGIFGVIGVFLLLATAASVMTTAGLTLVAWVPIAGLISVPLRAAAWLIQGLLFQFLALTALSAYQTQYRRFAEPATPISADRVRGHA